MNEDSILQKSKMEILSNLTTEIYSWEPKGIEMLFSLQLEISVQTKRSD